MSSTWLTHTHGSVSLEDHDEASRQAQRRADKWMIVGAALMGMWAPGLIGFPIFMRGIWLQRQALRAGLSVRPMIVTLIGYLVLIDGCLNSLGWALDLVANHTLINPVLMVGWGNMYAYPILRRDVGVQIPLPAVGATGRRRGQGHRPGRVGHPADAEIPPARIP